MDIVKDLTEALKMAAELPFLIALPIYGIAYAVFIWALAKAIRAVRDALK